MADGASPSFERILIYIIAFIVLITFILFYFRADIQTYFSNVPGLGSKDTGTITEVEDNQPSNDVNTLCPYQVGSWKTESNVVWGFDARPATVEITGIGETSNDPIYSRATSSSKGFNGDLYLRDISFFQSLDDENVIGTIKDNKISITAAYLPYFFLAKTSDPDYYSRGDDFSFTPTEYYSNIAEYGSMPSFQMLVNFDGAYIARTGEICRSEAVDYESEVKKRLQGSKESNVFIIRYTSGFDDIIAFKWSFSKNQPAVNIIVNKGRVNNGAIYNNQFVYGAEAAQTKLKESAIKEDLYEEEISGISNVMNSKDPYSFATNIWTFMQQNEDALPFGVSLSQNEITSDSVLDVIYTTNNEEMLARINLELQNEKTE